MRIYKTSIVSFIFSVMIAALIFYGIPMLVCLFDGEKPQVMICELTGGALMFFFGLYVVIQFVLSVVNMIQAFHLETQGLLFDDAEHHSFYKAEFILYMIVFCIPLFIFYEEAVLCVFATFIFSVPYIICCTISVRLFRSFLRRAYPAELTQVNTPSDETL